MQRLARTTRMHLRCARVQDSGGLARGKCFGSRGWTARSSLPRPIAEPPMRSCISATQWTDRRSAGPRTVRWFCHYRAGVTCRARARFYGFNRYRSQAIATLLRQQQAAAGADRRRDGRDAECAALCCSDRIACRRASGDDHARGWRQGDGDLLHPWARLSKRGDPLVQLNDAPERGRPGELRGAVAHGGIVAGAQFAACKQTVRPRRETVDQNQSQLDQARAQILKTQALIGQKLIRAPVCRAARHSANRGSGNMSAPGAAVVTLTDLKELYVNFTLASTWKGQIELGQKVNVTGRTRFPGRSFTATITTIEPQIRSDTRTLTAQATLANPGRGALAGDVCQQRGRAARRARQRSCLARDRGRLHALWRQRLCGPRGGQRRPTASPILKVHRTPVKIGQRWEGQGGDPRRAQGG